MLGTCYQFAHYKMADPEDPASPQFLAWANGLGDLDESIRRGSAAEIDALAARPWADNFLTDGGEQQMLESFFRNNHTPTFYFGLWSATPAETSDLTLSGEVSGTGYARIAVTRGTSDWGAAALDSGDHRTLSATKTFTAGGAWSAATRLALVSPSSGTSGTLYAIVALGSTRTLANTDQLNVSMAVKQQ